MKFKLLFSSRVFHACACLGMIAAAPIQAAVVTVFLDNGVNAPGSTNTAIPFVTGDRVATWDVTAAQQGGLTSLGAAVMEVRMVTLNVNGDSRAANTGGGNGLGVDTGGNVAWPESLRAPSTELEDPEGEVGFDAAEGFDVFELGGVV